MNILGVNSLGHDTGAALISDGKIIAIAEERLNREKNTAAFPKLSVQYCLRTRGLEPKDIDIIAMGNVVHFDHRYLVGTLKNNFGDAFVNAKFVTVNHHDAHAASAFFCSPFEEAAILVYDGGGESFVTQLGMRGVETETLYFGQKNRIVQIQKTLQAQDIHGEYPYTIGIGRLYALFSRHYIGLGRFNEGKMMGLAAYGDDSFLKQYPYERWVASRAGHLLCNGKILFKRWKPAHDISPPPFVVRAYHAIRSRARNYLRIFFSRIASQMAQQGFIDLSTAPHIMEAIVMPRPARNPNKDGLPDSYYSSVAYAAQKIFERFATDLTTRLRFVTKSDNICIAGGCGLNIDANLNFLNSVGFKNIFVQPAASDAGIPLGSALWAAHHVIKMPRFYEMKSASLGRLYTEEEVLVAIDEVQEKIVAKKSSNITKETAQHIADGNIIGWFQGGGEYGPRALGNRSILCDARRKDMKDVLNNRVKHRESWRPFAASILAEKQKEWFEISADSPFMLLAGQVVEEKKKLVPSIVHVDGTCRVQSVTREQNTPYYQLLKEFYEMTGIPLVLNTSFNLGGEPIVETPHDALDTFLRTNMDFLIIHNFIIHKK